MEAKQIFKSRFAGVWIDENLAPARIRVGVVALSEQDRALWAKRTDFGDEVGLVDRNFSLRDLARFRRTATAYLMERKAFCMIGYDYRHNAVKVVVIRSLSNSVKQGLYARTPARAIRYSTSPCKFHT